MFSKPHLNPWLCKTLKIVLIIQIHVYLSILKSGTTFKEKYQLYL